MAQGDYGDVRNAPAAGIAITGNKEIYGNPDADIAEMEAKARERADAINKLWQDKREGTSTGSAEEGNK
jgi:hypothetical protein